MNKNEAIFRISWSGMGNAFAIFVAALSVSTLTALSLAWIVDYTEIGALLTQLLPAGEKTAWYMTRSSAVVAYLLLSGSMIWGLALSTKVVKDFVPPPLALALHNSLSWLAVGMAAFHAFVLLFDYYYHYRIADLLIPFVGPYRPQSVGLGILSFYGLLLVAVSFGVRKWLGQRNWRRLHYLSFVLYLLVTVHGFTAGSDSQTPIMQTIYVGSIVSILFLTNYRILMVPK